MNQQIILRIRSPQGQHRITVMSRDTFGQLLLQISKKLNYSIKDLIVNREDNRPLNITEKIKLGDVPYFQDGAVLQVQSKNPRKPNITPGPPVSNQVPKPKSPSPAKNNNQRGTSPSSPKNNDKQDWKKYKPKCQHGPNARCVHCLDSQFISDAAHISFDNWLAEKKLKCKGVHPPWMKCNNCLPPSLQNYTVDPKINNNQPNSKRLSNLPPNVVIKRQEYRHVDYVQFMNVAQIQQFVRYWLPRSHQQQRVAYLYGYYAQDPSYKGGIRVIVQAMYEPKQKGSISGFEVLQKEQSNMLTSVVSGLTLQRVGWLFTETNHDVVMSEKHVRMAAQMQNEYRVTHQSGYQISNFISVILRPDQKDPNQVHPQVYMISDQGQALENADLFVQSASRRKMQVKVNQNPNDAFPMFLVAGKSATQFQPQFLLVKIAHGTSKSNKFAIVKKAQFPVSTRGDPKPKDLKEYMRRYRNVKQSCLKYGDFNLLMYLAKEIDPQTAHNIAEAVASQTQVSEYVDEMIEHLTDR